MWSHVQPTNEIWKAITLILQHLLWSKGPATWSWRNGWSAGPTFRRTGVAGIPPSPYHRLFAKSVSWMGMSLFFERSSSQRINNETTWCFPGWLLQVKRIHDSTMVIIVTISHHFIILLMFWKRAQPSAHVWPRFGEWSIASANKQLGVLNDNTSGPAFHYMGLYLNDDTQIMNQNSSTITGMFVSKWWDQSSEAGPKRRPRSTFDEPVPTLDVLAVANGAVKILDSTNFLYLFLKSKTQGM